jgi:ABC-type thiamine transport system substrate-binding protein
MFELTELDQDVTIADGISLPGEHIFVFKVYDEMLIRFVYGKLVEEGFQPRSYTHVPVGRSPFGNAYDLEVLESKEATVLIVSHVGTPQYRTDIVVSDPRTKSRIETLLHAMMNPYRSRYIIH